MKVVRVSHQEPLGHTEQQTARDSRSQKPRAGKGQETNALIFLLFPLFLASASHGRLLQIP